jgi:hypothetical protein
MTNLGGEGVRSKGFCDNSTMALVTKIATMGGRGSKISEIVCRHL